MAVENVGDGGLSNKEHDGDKTPGHRNWDCIVCGSCTVDIIARPVALDTPIGHDTLHRTDPIVANTGGLVSNSGIAMARLGARVAALSRVGNDPWGEIIRKSFAAEGLDSTFLEVAENEPSSVTVVLVNDQGQRSFIHSQGAPKGVNFEFYHSRLDLFENARCMLLGYYSLTPGLDPRLPELFKAIRERGCWTAMDSASPGGTMEPLDQILPHLDYYVPSLSEAMAQTGERDPKRIVDRYRDCGATGILGVKLGAKGAVLSSPDEWLEIPPVSPPGPVIDTTGAGDGFYAGLLRGRLLGWDLRRSGQLAALVGACSVTGMGASTAVPRWEHVQRMIDSLPPGDAWVEGVEG